MNFGGGDITSLDNYILLLMAFLFSQGFWSSREEQGVLSMGCSQDHPPAHGRDTMCHCLTH